MGRSIPVWLVLLLILFGLLGTVIFGWAVKSAVQGNNRVAAYSDTILEIASFPSTAKQVVRDLTKSVSGEGLDEFFLVRNPQASHEGFALVESDIEGLEGLLIKAAASEEITPGWRLLSGVFVLNDRPQNAALLVSPELKVVRAWPLDEVPVGDLIPRPHARKMVHGIDMLPDGSLIFTFGGAISLQRFDACAKRLWSTGGAYHHAVSLSEDQKSVWTFSDEHVIAQVSVEDGGVVREISMDEIIAANPDTDILEIRRLHSSNDDPLLNRRNTKGRWLADPMHLNDVEELSTGLADKFKGLDAGDLMLSARSLNLIFVIDPESLKIKWWRSGAVQRQHDPDFLETGEIMVYNNRMSRDYSDIIAINAVDYSTRVLFDGRKNNFYSRIRGKSQMLPGGALSISSPQQGRTFEIGSTGEVVLEFLNAKPGSKNEYYVITEMKWLPMINLNPESWTCP